MVRNLSSDTKLRMIIHIALDYFFCDRCPIEATLPGRPIEWGDHWLVRLIDKLCPIQHFFRFLPEEKFEEPRRIYFPRSWLEGTKFHETEKDGIRT
jgi:hypothetical protein